MNVRAAAERKPGLDAGRSQDLAPFPKSFVRWVVRWFGCEVVEETRATSQPPNNLTTEQPKDDSGQASDLKKPEKKLRSIR